MGITLRAKRHGADGIRRCDTVQRILGDPRLFLIIHFSKYSYAMFAVSLQRWLQVDVALEGSKVFILSLTQW